MEEIVGYLCCLSILCWKVSVKKSEAKLPNSPVLELLPCCQGKNSLKETDERWSRGKSLKVYICLQHQSFPFSLWWNSIWPHAVNSITLCAPCFSFLFCFFKFYTSLLMRHYMWRAGELERRALEEHKVWSNRYHADLVHCIKTLSLLKKSYD